MAKLIFKGAVGYEVTVTRRLIPIPDAPGPRAPGGIAFRCRVGSWLSEGRDYVLADDDGSYREVTVGELSVNDRGGHGLAYYLDVPGV